MMYSRSGLKQAMSRGLLGIAGTVSLLSMVLGFGGCTVGPDFVKPEVKLNENWSQTSDSRISTQAAADSQWWKNIQ